MPTVHKIRVDNRIYTVQTDGPEPPTEAEMDAALGTSGQAGAISASPAEPETNWAREAAIMAASALPYGVGAFVPATLPYAPAASGAIDFSLRALLGEKGEAQRSILPNLANIATGPALRLLPKGITGKVPQAAQAGMQGILNLPGKVPQAAQAGMQGILNLLGYGGNVAAGQEEYSNVGAGVAAGLPLAVGAVGKGIGLGTRGLATIFAPGAVSLAKGEEARHGTLYKTLAKFWEGPSAESQFADIRAQGAGLTEDIVELRAAQKLLGGQEADVRKYIRGLGSSKISAMTALPEKPPLPRGAPIIAPNGKQALDFYGKPMFSNPTPQQVQDYDDLMAVFEGTDVPFEIVWRLKTRTNERLKTAQNPLNPDYETIGVMKKLRSALQDDIDNSTLSPALKAADKRYAREASLTELQDAAKARWRTDVGVDTLDATGLLNDFVAMRYIIDAPGSMIPGQATVRPKAGGQVADKFFVTGFKKNELDELETFFRKLAYEVHQHDQTGIAVRASVMSGLIGGVIGAGLPGVGAASAIGYALPGLFFNIATSGPKTRRMFLAAARAGKGRFTQEGVMAISQIAEQERAALGAFGTTGAGKEFTVEVAQPDEPGKEDWEEVR